MGKRIISLLVAVMMTVGFVGCGSKQTTETPKTETQKTEEAKKVKISLWHSFVGADQRAKLMEDLMNEFRTKYPDIEVDEQKIPHDQYKTKLKTQAAAGQLPDTFIIWPNAMTKEFVKANLLADINDLISKNPEWRNGFVDKAIDEFTVDGKTYSAGIGVSVTSIAYYNKALFDKYNLTYPKNYEELKNVIKVFNQNGIIPIALGNKAKWPLQSSIFSTLADRQTGTEWLKNVLAKKDAKFTDPQFIAALNKVKELTDLGAFNKDYNSVDEVQVRDYFYKGQAAMMITGSWALPDIIGKVPADLKQNIELTVLPAFEDGDGDPNVVSGVSSTGVAINAKVTPEQKEAAGKLIMHLTNKEAQEKYTIYSVPVSYKNVKMDESKLDPLYVKLVKLIEKYPLVTVYDSALNSEQTEIINNGLQAIMIGQQKPEELAKALQNTIK
ncbi:MAG: putative extracellular solute-binding protein family 1 [Clostridia bacterium]|jgi:raffinose/stachyose/melibiose transport system substrate-binding protein|nr:putative extracellular solute-binding protein family 1 [Clostridia bacterium]